MKTAIYIEDGVVHFVLTPQNEFEKSTIYSLSQKRMECVFHSGSFYRCLGGWSGNGGYDNSPIIMKREEKKHESCGGEDVK